MNESLTREAADLISKYPYTFTSETLVYVFSYYIALSKDLDPESDDGRIIPVKLERITKILQERDMRFLNDTTQKNRYRD